MAGKRRAPARPAVRRLEDPPRYFELEGAEELADLWRETLAEEGVSVETRADAELLEAYCVERRRWLEAERMLSAEGEVLTLRDEKGEVSKVIANPWLDISRKASAAMLKYGDKLRGGV